MNDKKGWGLRSVGIALVLAVLTGFSLIAAAQACGDAGCWALEEPIYIYGNAGFTCDNGVVSGSGSQYDPYIIEGWRIVASGASYGIDVENTSKYFVIRNTIVEGASGAGIHFYGVENGTIEGCQLLRNERGILFENSEGHGITGNLIADNHYGIDLVVGTRNTAISKNSFVLNGRNGYDPAGRNLWYCAAVGNYWYDYTGPDADCDGIGDVAYRAPVDRYPLMASPWPCTISGNDSCAPYCDDSTGILQTVGASSPCAPTCTTATGCAQASPCQPEVKMCADQVLTCANPVVTLTAEFCPSQPGCLPCTIQWIRDGGAMVGTGPSIQVREPGTYTATINGANGCQVSRSVTVISDANPPAVQASVDGELSCQVDEVVLHADISGGCQPYAIEWRRSGTGVLGSDSEWAVSQPGTYTVTVTGANGCSDFDTVTVTQDLQAPRVNAIVDGELTCAVPQVKLTALASNGKLPYAYAWTGPNGASLGTTGEIYVSAPGTYTVRVTGANGCSGLGTVIVTEDATPPTVDVRGTGTLTCTTTELTLTANISHGRPPYQIEWVGPSGNIVGTAPVLDVSGPGTYTVTVTGANGCSTSSSVTVAQDVEPPSVDAGPDQMLSNDVTQVTVTAQIGAPDSNYTVAWTDESGQVLSTDASLVVDRPGEYMVTVTRDTGCTASDTVAVNSSVITEVMLSSGIDGLAVFGQLLKDGVPIPGSVFYFQVGSTQEATDGVEISSVALRTSTGEGFEANGAEVNYIIPGNAVVTFQIHKDQFIAGKWYQLLHLPTDPPGAAAVKFF